MKTRKGGRTVADGLMLAPVVAVMRLPMMAAEMQAYSSRYGETTRAVSEKLAAGAEGLFAAQLSMIGSLASFWPEVLSGKAPSILNGIAAQRSIEAALRPASRQVQANFRRLSTKR